MVVEGVAATSEEGHVAPTSVLGGQQFQDNHDEGSYVLDHSSLRVEVGGQGNLVVGAVVIGGEVIVGVVVRKWRHQLLSSGDLALQIVSGILLLLPSKGNSTLVLMCIF